MTLLGPTAVAIHDHSDMAGQAAQDRVFASKLDSSRGDRPEGMARFGEFRVTDTVDSGQILFTPQS